MSALLAVIGRFFTYAPLRLLAGVVLLVLTLAAGLGLLAASGYLIAGTALAGLGLIAFDTFRPSAAIRFFALARTGARYLERLVSHDATFRVLAALRVDVFRGIAAAPARVQRRSADLLARLSGDLDALDAVHLRFVAPVGAAFTALLALGVVYALLSPVLAVAVLVPAVGLGVVAPVWLAARGRRDARRRHHGIDAIRRRIVDLDRGRTEWAVAGRLGEAASSVTAAADRVAAVEARQHRRDMAVRAAGLLAGQVAIVGALLVGADLLAAGAVSGPVFVLIVLAAFTVLEAVQPLRALALDLGRMILAAGRIAPLMRVGAAEGHRSAESLAPSIHPAGPMAIRLDAVTVRADDGRPPLLDGVSLAIVPGERVALVGPSGAGKSTILAVIAGLVPPTDGRVDVGGRPVVGPGGPDGAVGLLTQRIDLFQGDVADVLRLGRPDAPDAALGAAVTAAGLDPVLGPRDGLAFTLGEGGSGLSGGERRRLALARLLVADPSVVLLDEPTDGLDAVTADAVLAALSNATAGRTLVVATHRRTEAALADRLVSVRDGRIVADARRGEPAFDALMHRLTDPAADLAA
ncbi:thiol reductant ABC exporter subunit CydC [Mongoliimonas terrestris]|uniref:thiol reductant ABC exporter subunit CydC n=1 Tax=Mongoliimonas terrestris TaxID=1709001 RepID=UPI0009498346|nr:thiol reductant ABC exporter subunit CydC [Mongoliimonas terrestris]